MSEARSIAVIGLGAMGFALAKRLVEGGHRVSGYDIRPDVVLEFAAIGGAGAESVSDAVSSADVIIVFVMNSDQLDHVLFAAGALEAAKPTATVISMVTAAPARIAEIAARVTATQRGFIDAPVSGGVPGIEAGTLTIMASAPQREFAAVETLLREIGSNTFHLGEAPGQGSAMKTVNQLLAGVHIAAGAEALALAEAEGIDPAAALEILMSGAAQSWMLGNRGPRMVDPGDTVASSVEIFVKDLGIVLATGTAARLGLPLSAAAHQQFLNASGLGLGSADDSQVIEAYRAFHKKPTP